MAQVKIGDNSHEVPDEVHQWMKNARDIINLGKDSGMPRTIISSIGITESMQGH